MNIPTLKNKPKWYFRTSVLIVGFLTVGPFVLPAVWFNPGYSTKKKVVISLVILVLSWVILKLTVSAFQNIRQLYQMMNEIY